MFKQIKAKNLFSWADLDYTVVGGVSQISGFNYDDATSEGCGKSSIPNILCWTLYGKIPKDAKIDEVIKDGQSSGWGEVYLVTGHIVIRGRKPNILKIVTPQNTVIQGKDAKETQKLIEDLIGLSFSAFCQTIYFAQNYPEKFISSNESDKAAILSEVLDLKIFDRARSKVLTELAITQTTNQTLSHEIKILEVEILEKTSSLKQLNAVIDAFAQQKAQTLLELQQRIDKNCTRIQTINTSLDVPSINVDGVADAIEEIRNRLAQANAGEQQAKMFASNYEQLQKNITRARKRLETLQETSQAECTTCGQALPEALKQRHREEHTRLRDAAQKELLSLENEAAAMLPPTTGQEDTADLKKDLEAFKQLLLAKDQQAKQFVTLGSEKQHLIAANKTAQEQMHKSEAQNTLTVEAQVQELAKTLKIANKNLASKHQERAKLTTYIASLEALKHGFKDVKKYVFQNLLQDLTYKATKEAQNLFEVPVIINFSNQMSDGDVANIATTITLDGQVRPLGLLSGGQYRRIELAVSLALAELLKNRSAKAINFRIFDEPFKDLSETSMEKVVKLLEKLEGSTIIIEHNSITKSIINNEFFVEYRDGTSYASKTMGMPSLRCAS